MPSSVLYIRDLKSSYTFFCLFQRVDSLSPIIKGDAIPEKDLQLLHLKKIVSAIDKIILQPSGSEAFKHIIKAHLQPSMYRVPHHMQVVDILADRKCEKVLSFEQFRIILFEDPLTVFNVWGIYLRPFSDWFFHRTGKFKIRSISPDFYLKRCAVPV